MNNVDSRFTADRTGPGADDILTARSHEAREGAAVLLDGATLDIMVSRPGREGAFERLFAVVSTDGRTGLLLGARVRSMREK